MQIDGRDPERFAYFEYANQTTVHPVGLAALLAAIVWVFASRRQTLVWPVVVLLCFVAPAQRIVIGGLDLPFMRIIIMIALLHAVVSGGAKGLRSCWVDRAMAFLLVWWPLLAIVRGQFSGVATFVGTRMHACIAGLSSGVPTIGFGYSHKTRPVFETVSMQEFVIDLPRAPIEAATAQFEEALAQVDGVRPALQESVVGAKTAVGSFFDALLDVL